MSNMTTCYLYLQCPLTCMWITLLLLKLVNVICQVYLRWCCFLLVIPCLDFSLHFVTCLMTTLNEFYFIFRRVQLYQLTWFTPNVLQYSSLGSDFFTFPVDAVSELVETTMEICVVSLSVFSIPHDKVIMACKFLEFTPTWTILLKHTK